MPLKIGSVEFPHHVFCGPGSRGMFGKPYWYYAIWRFFGLSWWHTNFAAKTITFLLRLGNTPLKEDGDTPRERIPRSILITFWGILSGHLANAFGLSGPGAKFLLEQGIWQKFKKPFVLSFMAVGKTREERMAEYRGFRDLLLSHMGDFLFPFVLQLNFGCPNAELSLSELRGEIEEALRIMSELGVSLIINFNPLVPPELLLEIEGLELEGARLCQGFWIANTIHFDHDGLGERIFGSKISPLLKRGLPIQSAGGISGPACLKYTINTVRRARELGVTLPIIAGNGVQTPIGVWRLWKAGASGISIATIALLRPFMMILVILTANLLFGRFRRKESRQWMS